MDHHSRGELSWRALLQFCFFLLWLRIQIDVALCVLQDMAQREDLRHLVVCSVDPPGCTDIDDALHCRELENGNLEVHILYIYTLSDSTKLFMYVFNCTCNL